MQYSYSRVSLFNQCPYHFKLRYIDSLAEIPNYEANSPLIIGNALHKGIETNKDTMIKHYYDSYPIITDEIVNEAIKLEGMLPKVNEFLASNFPGCELIHEYKIDEPEYVGYVDLIVKCPDGQCLVIDFKYSNNIDSYRESEQLHIYKYFLEKAGFKIKKLGYLFVGKTNIRQKKTESLHQFRVRLMQTVKNAKVTFIDIQFDKSKVDSFFNQISDIEQATFYERNPNDDCFSCAAINAKKQGRYTTLTPPEYLEAIQDENGEIEMILPEMKRRNIEKVEKRVIWIYGAPFTGKTTFANDFPNPLMLNTDGNIKFVDAPFYDIANEVQTTGRITKTILAWDKLKDAIFELEKGENEFKTIVLDLLEDTYESCRLYMYEKLGIEHESDDSFRAWDKVRTEFLSTMKRLVHLPYENIILISHEDTSKDITKKGGDKTTAIKPNLADKPALKIAGMVDIVARVVANDDERKIVFKSKDYVFGGGRIKNLPADEINLDYEELIELYDAANKGLKKRKSVEKKEVADFDPDEEPTATKRKRRKKADVDTTEDEETPPGETTTMETLPGEDEPTEMKIADTEEPPKRKRRERKPKTEDEPVEEEKATRRRRRRESK
ncbi:AAA family ATPase [Enterococcus sp. LJL128]